MPLIITDKKKPQVDEYTKYYFKLIAIEFSVSTAKEAKGHFKSIYK